MTVITLIYIWVYVPEAPKYKYAFREFTQSKDILKQVAASNYIEDEVIERRFNFKFDTEIVEVED